MRDVGVKILWICSPQSFQADALKTTMFWNQPDVPLLVKLLKVTSLLLAAVPTDRRHVEHAIPELDECSSLDWDVQIRNVPQHKVYEALQPLLS
jgi:hypothetical protein